MIRQQEEKRFRRMNQLQEEESRRRMIQEQQEEERRRRMSYECTIPDYFYENYAVNPQYNNQIVVSASSMQNKLEPANVFENTISTYFCSQAESSKGEFIEFDFKLRKVRVLGYIIQTFEQNTWDDDCQGDSSGMGAPNLKSWVLEASDDGKVYEIIDEENNCPKLNGNLLKSSFPTNHTKSPSTNLRCLKCARN